ncbi:hypothetical protein ACD591_20045 [Rufibacter glacialis]|uniref:STAS/SEC14 domain-containing protein n=1 Tax=Rufibacter glacialis TaxID=1259555 RepID=A0A5M8Q6T2_9BACT|nr:hypothetical protein [Rufibacter glacialis]KAA6430634.1 hypothetical protein FOE74_19355 [Rufibacter glacialis]GGK85303.1 hypothetical protein GCM10011405_36440 [Rufibacter glacialis]
MHIDLQPQLVYQDDFLLIEVDLNVKYIQLEWVSSPSTTQFQESFRTAATIALDIKGEYWLSDAKIIPFLEFSAQNWVMREMAPLLQISPLKKFARLSSKESIALLDMHRIYNTLANLQEVSLKTKFESFTTKEAAQEWLFSEYELDHAFSQD